MTFLSPDVSLGKETPDFCTAQHMCDHFHVPTDTLRILIILDEFHKMVHTDYCMSPCNERRVMLELKGIHFIVEQQAFKISFEELTNRHHSFGSCCWHHERFHITVHCIVFLREKKNFCHFGNKDVLVPFF
jgi:hypothetical protein